LAPGGLDRAELQESISVLEANYKKVSDELERLVAQLNGAKVLQIKIQLLRDSMAKANVTMTVKHLYLFVINKKQQFFRFRKFR